MKTKLLTFIICLSLVFAPTTSHAGSIYDFLVGGAIKNLAKVYVKTTNIAKLKAKYVAMILKMREDKFHKYYNKFFVVYKQLPEDLKKAYPFEEHVTKDDVIAKIDQVNKRDIITIINKIPSDFIVYQTHYYTHPPKDVPPGEKPQVNEMYLWRGIMQKV